MSSSVLKNTFIFLIWSKILRLKLCYNKFNCCLRAKINIAMTYLSSDKKKGEINHPKHMKMLNMTLKI